LKCIIAGGRDFIPANSDYNMIKHLIKDYKITEIASGGASGADAFGEEMASLLNIKCKVFPANWKKYDKKAGYIRNKQMGDYTDYAILMKGNIGTSMMRDIVIKLRKNIIYDAKDIF
jgi:hypothetical protein